MAKKAAKPQTEDAPPEQSALESQPPDPPAAAISKAEAVRQALAAGKESPDDGTEFIKSRYGIDMTNQTFSSYKGQQKARDAKQAGSGEAPKRGRKPKDASPAVTSHAAPATKHRGNGEGDLLETLEALKPLIAQHGADRVKRLVDLLG